MKKRLLAVFLVGLLTALGSHAQDEPPTDERPPPPDLESLQSGWWVSYFEEIETEERLARTDLLLQAIETRRASLAPDDLETSQSILAAIRENLDAYEELLQETVEAPPALGAAEEAYSIDQLLELAAVARRARAEADEQAAEVEREQRILSGVRERRDLAFNRYLSEEPGDQKFMAGLRLMQIRSALALAERRVDLFAERSRNANALAEATSERVEVASTLLPTTVSDDEFARLQADVDKASEAKDEAEKRLQATEVAASVLTLDTPEGRSQQRLDRQKFVEAQVVDALARLRWYEAHTLRVWALLVTGDAPASAELEEQSVGVREYVRTVRGNVPEWRQDTANELLAAQTTSRDRLNRAARRLLDQRVGTAQATLTSIDELEAAAEDLELLSLVAENAYVENVGTLQSWTAITRRFFREAYQRVGQIADTTLFSIGETPVAGSDILRVLFILFVSYLLSRLVRHGFARLGRNEDPGRQASLYTIGRLSHYAIITIGIIVALSSMGLDFGNLAIIAGALSVGIGFGLQSIVGNFVSGLIILFEHALRVGDYIELDNGLTGTVKAINFRSTLVRTNDNVDIVVPNSEFATTRLTNWTLGERVRRVRVPFGVAYGSDKEIVKKAALEAAAEVPYTLTNMKGREVQVWLVEFGESSLNFLMLVWVNRHGAKRPGKTVGAYLWALETKLREYGIEVPFPQRDLHLRSGWKPGADAPEPEQLPEELRKDAPEPIQGG